MSDILNKICENKKIEIEIAKNKCSYVSLEKIIRDKKNRKFKKLLIHSKNNQNTNIIAEIKKASPSAGEIIKNYYPEIIASEYEKSGIGAISIVTEKKYFLGCLDHLSLINKKTNIPIIRKDFIIDPYQILESKVYKADAILLILSILSDSQTKDFISLANQYGLDCLIEAHTEKELERAINIGYPIIGINNRNLKDLSISVNNTVKLVKKIPKEFIIVAESGIKTREEINIYNDLGIFNFLIGESILKAQNFSKKIREFLN